MTYYRIHVTLGPKSIPKRKSFVMGLSPQESNIHIHSTITLHKSLSHGTLSHVVPIRKREISKQQEEITVLCTETFNITVDKSFHKSKTELSTLGPVQNKDESLQLVSDRFCILKLNLSSKRR